MRSAAVTEAATKGRRAVTAAVAGNVLEWYDFAVYGYLAGLLAKRFFPASDELTGLLAAFAAFGVGFVVRPLGAILIGRLADRRGRKVALVLTIMLMTLGTVGIGLIPDQQAIGVLAPGLLVACRLLQGFSAGGEWGGATAFLVEWAPSHRRGLFGSFQQASVAAGLLLGSGVAALCSTLLAPEQMEAWGWRLPFLSVGCCCRWGCTCVATWRKRPRFATRNQCRPRPRRAGQQRRKRSGLPCYGRWPTISR